MTTEKQKLFLKVFFSFFFIFSVIKIYDNAVSRDAWQYGEWLINYDSGFIRRGLTGEIIQNLAIIFNKNIEYSFIFFVSILSGFYYFLNYKFLQKIQIDYFWLIFLFSPLLFFLIVTISKIGINKIIIFYSLFLLYLFFLNSSYFNSKTNLFFYSLIPLFLLIHEGFFFFLGYFILAPVLLLKKSEIKKIYLHFFYLLFLSVIAMAFLYFNKGDFNSPKIICDSLETYAPMKCDWWGPISALGEKVILEGENDWKFFYIHKDYITYAGFIFYIFYSYIPIYLFFKISDFSKQFFSKTSVLLMFLLTFLFSLPLYLIAEDWVRWFSYHFNFIFYLLVSIYLIRRVSFNNNQYYQLIKNKLNLRKYKYIFFLLIFLYPVSFHHHHFFWEGVRLEFTLLKIIRKF